MKQLQSRDLETGLEQVLWEGDSFAFWSVTSVMNSLGHLVYIALHMVKGRLEDPVYVFDKWWSLVLTAPSPQETT